MALLKSLGSLLKGLWPFILLAIFSGNDEEKGKIDKKALDKALQRLADQTSQYLTEPMFAKLKEIKSNNEKGLDTPFDKEIQEMLEKILVMEYQDKENLVLHI